MSSFNVLLRNSGVELQVAPDEPIYQAALKAGVQLPIGCDYGGCITCAAKLVEGKVRQPGASALNQRQSQACLLYTSPSPRDKRQSRMPSSA